MIQRVVLIELQPDYRNDADRRQIAEHSRQVLADIPLVRGLEVGTPADERSRHDWDLCILVRFDNLEDVEAYRVDETHRKYVDVFLKPMMRSIRVFNFDVP